MREINKKNSIHNNYKHILMDFKIAWLQITGNTLQIDSFYGGKFNKTKSWKRNFLPENLGYREKNK